MTGGIVITVAHANGLALVAVALGAEGPMSVTLRWPGEYCSIKPGDEVQWRGECAIWTPRDRAFTWQAWVVET